MQGQNKEMLLAACEQFLGKSEDEIRHIALETLEGHQRAIMGTMTVEVMTTFPTKNKSFKIHHLSYRKFTKIGRNLAHKFLK